MLDGRKNALGPARIRAFRWRLRPDPFNRYSSLFSQPTRLLYRINGFRHADFAIPVHIRGGIDVIRHQTTQYLKA
jgi:hypothetical protein